MKLFKIIVAIILVLKSFLYVNAQAINPERGDGFWTQVNPMRMEQIIWVNDTLYASRSVMYQSNGGVYRSTDGGLNWDTLYSKSEFTSSGLRLFIHPTNHKILFLTDGALYKSTNAGQSWNYVVGATGPFVRLAINPKNPNIMYITKSIPFGTVYKTTDAGVTWNISGAGLVNNQYFQAGPIDINPEYPDTILLGTNAGLYRSTNGGLNWDTTEIKGFIPGVNFHPKLPNIAFTSSDYNWSTYKTSDYGESWNTIVGINTAIKFITHPTKNNIIYNSSNSKSLDTGDTWVKMDTLYNSWTDIANNEDENTTLFGLNNTYGLFTYRDIISNVFNESLETHSINMQNFPNPFNPSTTVQFTLPSSQSVTIQIFNSIGQLIVTILQHEYLGTGTHKYYWAGTNDSGNQVSSGVYFCRFISNQNNFQNVKSLKMILLK